MGEGDLGAVWTGSYGSSSSGVWKKPLTISLDVVIAWQWTKETEWLILWSVGSLVPVTAGSRVYAWSCGGKTEGRVLLKIHGWKG